MKKPQRHYMATLSDGTVPPTCEHLARYYSAQGETIPTVNLTDQVGQTVDFPVKFFCSRQ
ncbi:hypothetical protein ACFU8Q_36195 [Streptomyces sp. NPDC057543]|uniref:hypothetical protein n=1 Tax=Streptomyces sp. NPDC057543 TaxID=3346163 RepID=UPI0036B77D2D